MQNHYFDNAHPLRPYTHSLAAMPGTVAPTNALRGDKPTAPDGFWPAEKNGGWENIEDHRGKEGYLDGKPHTIKEHGPLPEGWSDTPPEPTTEEKAAQIRAQRNGLMSGTDYLMLPDYPITEAAREEVQVYRQALRDITLQADFPEEVTWPDKPMSLA